MTWLIKILLFTPSKLYGLAVSVRNKCYDWQLLHSKTVATPTIVIGNLEIGGSGKTIHTELLIDLLHPTLPHIAVLSRGYKRQTSGFVLADAHATPATIGDEPYQIHQKYAPNVQVAACADRLEGIQKITELFPKTQLILLDDGFQHRALQAGFYILLTDFSQPFYQDNLLPMGRLREHKRAAKRADIIIFTKTPDDLNLYEQKRLADLAKSVPRQKIFFSYLSYDNLLDFNRQIITIDPKNTHALLVAGIAKPQHFVAAIQKKCAATTPLFFADHHQYKHKDLDKIAQAYHKITATEKRLVCTEKDWVKLSNHAQFFIDNDIKCAFLPVKARLNPADAAHIQKTLIDYTKHALLLKNNRKV